MTVKQLVTLLIAVWAITIIVIINISYGFEMTEQLKQDEQFSQICTIYNIETPECYEIIGDIESTYEPPQ